MRYVYTHSYQGHVVYVGYATFESRAYEFGGSTRNNRHTKFIRLIGRMPDVAILGCYESQDEARMIESNLLYSLNPILNKKGVDKDKGLFMERIDMDNYKVTSLARKLIARALDNQVSWPYVDAKIQKAVKK